MDYCNQHLMEIRQKYDTLLQQLQQTHTFHIHSSFAIKPKGSRDHIDPAGQSQRVIIMLSRVLFYASLFNFLLYLSRNGT